MRTARTIGPAAVAPMASTAVPPPRTGPTRCDKKAINLAVRSTASWASVRRELERGRQLRRSLAIQPIRQLALERPDVDDDGAVAVAVPGAGPAALIGRRSPGAIAMVNGRAAGQECVRFGRPAVVRQLPEQGVDGVLHRADQVAGGSEPGGVPVDLADQVVPQTEEVAGNVLLVPECVEVLCDDRVHDEELACAAGGRNNPRAAAGQCPDEPILDDGAIENRPAVRG